MRWLFYTSGTTADPKGAQHTDRTITAVASGMSQRLAITDADRNALAFPFTHVGGITWLFTSLMMGMANILFEAFVPDLVVEVLGAQGVTLAGSGTAFHQAYLAAQRKQRRRPSSPSCATSPVAVRPSRVPFYYEMKEAFGAPIVSGYGLTEAPVLTMGSVLDLRRGSGQHRGRGHARRRAQAGQAGRHPGRGRRGGRDPGQGPPAHAGYLDASLDADGFDEDGYFRTGDLGTLNERDMLSITGRLKDIIIRKGENVSAKEVEDLLFAHPKVLDVAVIGLPDPQRGERVCAVVSTPEGVEPLALRRDGGVPQGPAPDDPEDPRAARTRRGHPAQPHRQDPQARAAQDLQRQLAGLRRLLTRHVGGRAA